MIKSVAIKLGYPPDHAQYIKPHPLKLLINGSNDCNLTQDTQQMEVIFASLIIQLPSKYEVSYCFDSWQ